MPSKYPYNKIFIYQYREKNAQKIRDYDRLRKYKQYQLQKAWLQLCAIDL